MKLRKDIDSLSDDELFRYWKDLLEARKEAERLEEEAMLLILKREYNKSMGA